MRTLFQSYTHRPAKRTLVVSMSVHSLILGALIILPLISYAALPETRLIAEIISPMPPAAPPPPGPPEPSPPPSGKPEEPPARPWVRPMVRPILIPDGIDEPPSNIASLTKQPSALGGIPQGAAGNLGIPSGLQAAEVLPGPPKPKSAPAAGVPKQVRISEGIVLSKVIRKVHPKYPPLAREIRISGAVRLDITIDELGDVIDIRVISGPEPLVKNAREAVSQWKFTPTLLNNRPVKVKASINIIFKLN